MTGDDALLRVHRERLCASGVPDQGGILWVVARKPVGSPRGAGSTLAEAVQDLDRQEREERAESLLS